MSTLSQISLFFAFNEISVNRGFIWGVKRLLTIIAFSNSSDNRVQSVNFNGFAVNITFYCILKRNFEFIISCSEVPGAILVYA